MHFSLNICFHCTSLLYENLTYSDSFKGACVVTYFSYFFSDAGFGHLLENIYICR